MQTKSPSDTNKCNIKIVLIYECVHEVGSLSTPVFFFLTYTISKDIND